MFMVRNAITDDHDSLLRLAKTVYSNNLPADPLPLRDLLVKSRRSFLGKIPPRDRQYVFSVVEPESGKVVGTSSLIAGKGTEELPRLVLKVRKREHYSRDLQSGHVQITLQLCQDVSASTEVGGLVLASAYRGTPDRLGSLLSKVRFSYIGMRPQEFSDKIIGEIMGTLTPDGRTMLWDHLGRRFINLSYKEADAFSRTSKEFITSLFPDVEIYASLLPAEARRLIGHVSPDAVPALRMLERLGFHHNDEVDPFDGGPYLEAQRDEIPLVKATRGGEAVGGLDDSDRHPTGIVCMQKGADFRAVRCPYLLDGDSVKVSDRVMDTLKLTSGMTVHVTALEGPAAETDQVSHGSVGA
ncbi:MAG: arginine N-succinyltransferase [Phycisphaerae bacterium]|nr:arginine N-succinyltransferase [Phycisphaerae bacterium]|tara:strand:- start:870 stop:1934 length:1065 start_codon:yes stop_codon:yes gene_type:complete